MRIDYIFSSAAAGASFEASAAVVDTTATGSDHFPLVVDFAPSGAPSDLQGKQGRL
jgi:endonuclease/exonuclease/phosphatase (EEP) superfamily protein YafD